ncbi:MAG: peptidoglycan binding domain-containing protein, partial [Rubrobacter sp.]
MARGPEVVRRRRRPGRGGDHGRRPYSGGGPRGLRSVPLLAGAAILLCAAISALVVGDHLANAGRIHRGVSVGDVALGGKTPEETRETLESRAPDTLEQVRLSGSAGSFAVPTEGLDARFDTGATVEAAYAVGRRGNLAQQLGDRARSVLGVGVPAEVRIRPGAVRSSLEELAARADEEPKDASVEIYGSDIRVSGSREGYRLDVAATARNLERNLQSLSGEARMYGEVLEPEVTTGEAEAAARDAREAVSGPLVLTDSGKSWTLSPDAVSSSLALGREGGTLQTSLDRGRLREAMATLYADLNVEPVEAGYDVGGGATPEISVTPGGEGRRIEDEKLLDA